jgi:hypothetical protein
LIYLDPLLNVQEVDQFLGGKHGPVQLRIPGNQISSIDSIKKQNRFICYLWNKSSSSVRLINSRVKAMNSWLLRTWAPCFVFSVLALCSQKKKVGLRREGQSEDTSYFKELLGVTVAQLDIHVVQQIQTLIKI